MRMLLLLLLFCLAFPAFSAVAEDFTLPAARTVRVQGTVSDADSGRPLPGVSVAGPGAATVSRFDGSFRIDLSSRGEAELWFEKDGYNSHRQKLSAKSAGFGLNITLRQRMGTLYGLLRSCEFRAGQHRMDDLSRETVQLEGKARSGQHVMLTVTPTREGQFAIFNLPVGQYLLRVASQTREVEIRSPGEEVTLGIVLRWCMRREFHPEMSDEGVSEAPIERKKFIRP